VADPVFRSAYDFLAPSPDANYGSVLPFAYNREGSPSWVTEGSNPRFALPEWLRSAAQGVVGLGESTQTGSLTPEALALLTTGSVGTGALMAPGGALAAGAARLTPAIKVGDRIVRDESHLKAAMRLPQNTPEEIAARKEAIMYGEKSRGFTDDRGRFLNRERAHEYALANDLIREDAPPYARTHNELISEWLKRAYGGGAPPPGFSVAPQQPPPQAPGFRVAKDMVY
jgi:hypothetical protein